MARKRLTAAHKAAIAAAQRGKKWTREQKIKLSLAQRRRRAREERG